MSESGFAPIVDWEAFDAVLFDLDGVLTDTARIHADAWKATFDDFLRERAESTGAPFAPFDIEADYHRFVDGKRRYDGVRAFLRSRNIDLPEGEPAASPGDDSICALGNRKNDRLNRAIAAGEVELFDSSVELVRRLRAAGKRTGVVSSSANCRAVLRAVDIEHLFDVRVDGRIAAERDLPGKPAPDTFLAAARELGVTRERSVVVEDAISGVQAGRAGGFGLVIGVARQGNADTLREHGANVVVSDLGELLDEGGR